MAKMYEDLPHTLFPESYDDEGNHPLMSDVTQSDTLPTKMAEYNQAVISGRVAEAKAILDSNQDLASCIFNADKYNWMRDAIIAIEKFYFDDVQVHLASLVNHTVGIDDENEQNNPGSNLYSIKKINELLDGIRSQMNSSIGDVNSSIDTVRTMVNGTSSNVTLAAGTWSGTTAPFTYEISNANITATNNVDVSLATNATLNQAKIWAKAMVMNATQAAGKITLKAYGKKPGANIPIVVTVHK